MDYLIVHGYLQVNRYKAQLNHYGISMAKLIQMCKYIFNISNNESNIFVLLN